MPRLVSGNGAGSGGFDATARNLLVTIQTEIDALIGVGPPLLYPDSPPFITGTPGIGNVLTFNHGTYTSIPDSYVVQWYRGTPPVPIASQTGMGYTQVAADNDQLVTASEIASTVANGAGFEEFAAPVIFTAPTMVHPTGTFTLAESAALGALAGTISGLTAGATPSLIDTAGNRVSLSGVSILRGATVLNYETAASHSFMLRQVLAGYANSPLDTPLTLNVTNVFEAPSLGALTLSASTIATGAAPGTVIGAIQGMTGGATPTLFDDAGGRFAISGGNLIAGLVATDVAVAPSHPLIIREILADSANSPRDSTVTVTVSASLGTSSLAAAAPTAINFGTRNGNAGDPASYRALRGPALTNMFGNNTTPAAHALALRIRFKPGELVSAAFSNISNSPVPVFGTNGDTGGQTLAMTYYGPQSGVGGGAYKDRFVMVAKDNAGNTITLLSALVGQLVDPTGVFTGLLVVRGDGTNYTLDIVTLDDGLVAGTVVTPATYNGHAGGRNMNLGYKSAATPSLSAQNFFPGAVCDLIQVDSNGTDAQWLSVCQGVAPATVFGGSLAAHFALRNTSDLAKTAGSRTYAAFTLDGTGHSTSYCGKPVVSADNSKGLAFAPVYRGYVHALDSADVKNAASLTALQALTGTISRDVFIMGASTHVQVRAVRKSDGAVLCAWQRGTATAANGRVPILLPGIPVSAGELMLEARREDDNSVIAQTIDDDRVGIVAVMGPSQSQMVYGIFGGPVNGSNPADPYTLSPGAASNVSFCVVRGSNLYNFPADGGYLRHRGILGSAMVLLANYWDSLATGVALELVGMSIAGTATYEWMYHRNTSSTGGATRDYWGDGQTYGSGYVTDTMLAKRRRATMFVISWHTADRSSQAGGSFTNMSTIYGSRSFTELAWTERWNELMGGVEKSTAAAPERAERSNFIDSGLSIFTPWSVIIPVSRSTLGTGATAITNAAQMTTQRKQQYDYAEGGIGKSGSHLVSLGGFQADIQQDGVQSPHQDLADQRGQERFGLRIGHAIAHVTKASAINPRSAFASATGAGAGVLTLAATLLNGGSLMVGVSGATIMGFEVSTDSGTNWSFYDGAVPFSVALGASNTVTLTKGSGTWPAGTTRVRYLAGAPISLGDKALDATALDGFLYESFAAAVPSGYTGSPAGVPIAHSFTNITPS